MSAHAAVESLCAALGLDAAAVGQLDLTGSDPGLPSSFRVGTAAQSAIAAFSLAAAQLWRIRTGRRQRVAVDMRHACAEFRSERYLRVDGAPRRAAWDELSGLYRCGDGAWVRVHTNFAHHRRGIVELLGCDDSRSGVADKLGAYTGEEFEDRASAAGMIAAKARTRDEWLAHPQGRALAGLALVAIERIGDGPADALPAASRPLDGIRVLDLTRIIAGPVCGRALAAHGADVMRIGSPNLPTIAPLVIDTGRGKRSAHVDLTQDKDRRSLQSLTAGADVFVQSYRPGALEEKGFGPADVAAIRPGIVYGSLCAYGQGGPWRRRRGFDSIVQTACGINADEAAAAGDERPRALPCQTLDHATGYLLAAGITAALGRRVNEGGSWHVQVSLARTANWLYSLGRDHAYINGPDMQREDIEDLIERSESGYGVLEAVKHAAQMSETGCRWSRPSARPGSDPPSWPAKDAPRVS